MDIKNFYARKEEFENKETEYQLIVEHLNNVSRICKEITNKIGFGEIGSILGKMHDIGKYSDDFQRRIRGENIQVDHATAGGKELEAMYIAKELDTLLYRVMAQVSVGHHSGLGDLGNSARGYIKRIKGEICDYNNWKIENEIQGFSKLSTIEKLNQLNIESKTLSFTIQFLQRFLFSALVDADRIDAQNFLNKEAQQLMSEVENIGILKLKFEKFMIDLQRNAKQSQINKIRTKIYNQCIEKSEKSTGFYTLSVPTGGGKTLASMGFALNHALKNKQERIIYAIPYTSIIEQNAKIYVDIFGKKNVLEHHCNYENPYKENSKESLGLKLAQENWYNPIIVTTNVQLFGTLFSEKPSRARKLHNIANSVIVLDEVQSIPINYVKPCMEALKELVRNYNCTIVLCSATQPEFEKNGGFETETDMTEIITDRNQLFKEMTRVKEEFIGRQSIDALTNLIEEQNQVLCIVNTKKHARQLFESIKKETDNNEGYYHLSTNMCPIDRTETIKKIREQLELGNHCKVISTQLIEAGVDIDFPVVYRAIAGLDSIAQAAGRCNREGKQKNGKIYVFEPDFLMKGYLQRTADISKPLLIEGNNFIQLECIKRYFLKLYNIEQNELDLQEVFKFCNGALEFGFEFKEIDHRFKLIDEVGYPLIIPKNAEAWKNVNKLRFVKKGLKGVLKKLAPYTINVKKYELDQLVELGVIRKEEDILILDEGEGLEEMMYYDEFVGLKIGVEDNFDGII